ncbi:hypothetical protein FRB90_005927, partial [Tulasnella sp. 427]
MSTQPAWWSSSWTPFSYNDVPGGAPAGKSSELDSRDFTPPLKPHHPSLPLAAPQPTTTDWLTFSGAPNESVGAFVQAVQRVAFQQNRARDNEWIADYASTCFADTASLWYSSLSAETQFNWNRLRAALFQRFPAQSVMPPSSNVPAMPGPSSAISTSSRALPPTPSVTSETGIIEVMRPGLPGFFGYLSLDSSGAVVIDRDPQKATQLQMVLHQDSSSKPDKIYNLKIVNVGALFEMLYNESHRALICFLVRVSAQACSYIQPSKAASRFKGFEPIYSAFPFIGVMLMKFPGEDLTILPTDVRSDWRAPWHSEAHVPQCCRVMKEYLEDASDVDDWDGPKKTGYSAWKFVPASKSEPGPYYMRRAKCPHQEAGVVSAIWTVGKSSRAGTEMGLVWPRGDAGNPGVVHDMKLEAVIHHGGTSGLHVHLDGMLKKAEWYLAEAPV